MFFVANMSGLVFISNSHTYKYKNVNIRALANYVKRCTES